MPENHFSNVVPTPYDLLVNFEDSGNATIVSYLFREKAEWLSSHLTTEQTANCEAIRAKLATWEEKEAVHGKGAALNLEHPKMTQMFREQPWVRAKYAAQIANAERLAALVDKA